MDICDSYHRDTEGFNAMARRQVGKQPGLLHAYRKAALEAGAKKTKAGKEIEVTHPLVPFRTVQDWWTEGKWTKDDAVTTTAGARPYLNRVQEDIFVHFCLQACMLGAALRLTEVKLKCKVMAQQNGTLRRSSEKFNTSMRGWLPLFLARANDVAKHEGYGDNAVSVGTARRTGGRAAQVLVVAKKGKGLSQSRARSLKPGPIIDFAENVIQPYLKARRI
jgi:hypothetical protein